MPFGFVAAAIAEGVADIGLTGIAADLAAGAIEGGLAGGALGAGEGLVTGGNIGQDALHGAEGGAITGGAIGAGGALGADAGIGATAGDVIGGTAGGALGAAATGGNPLLGAAEGGVAGGIAGYNASGAPVNSSGSTVGAPATGTNISAPGGAPVSAGQAGDYGNYQVDTQLNPSTQANPNLGSIGSAPSVSGNFTPDSSITSAANSADGAIGASPGAPQIGGATAADISDLSPPSTGGGASGTGIGSKALDLLNQPGPPSAGTVAANTGTFGGLTDPYTGASLSSAPAATAAAGSAPAASPSFLGQAESVGLKSALPLGALAYEAIKGPAALPAASGALAPGGANTAPLTAIETANANEAATGQLTPPQQQNILQYVQSQQNQLLQQLASEGVQNPTNDSRYIAGMQQIQNNALALQQQYIQEAVSNAVSAGGAASNNIATVANEQIANDTAFQDALASAFGALGGSIGGVNVTQKPAV